VSESLDESSAVSVYWCLCIERHAAHAKIRPYRMHNRCGLLRHMSHVAWSVSVCWVGEPIEMPFGAESCESKEYIGQESRSDESIRSRKWWQVSDAAFCQIILWTLNKQFCPSDHRLICLLVAIRWTDLTFIHIAISK